MKTLLLATFLVLTSVSLMAAQKKSLKNINPDPGTCILESLEGSGIGDIKYSILSEADFQAVHGSEWVLLKGQSFSSINHGTYDDTNNETIDDIITSGPYNSTTNLPDGRGRFLRMRDHGSGQNPEGNLNLGTARTYKTGLPTASSFVNSSGGAHTHTYTGVNTGSGVGGDGGAWRTGYATRTTASSGSHTHTISGGDSETSPKNITVNTFVKVRRACLDAKIQAALRCGPADSQTYPVACLSMPETSEQEQHEKVACLKAGLEEWETGTGNGKSWTNGCLVQTVAVAKKVLIDLGVNKTTDELNFYNLIVGQYPYYNTVTSTP